MLDATKIFPGIYQGSRPPLGDELSNQHYFDVLVLAAKEFQPPASKFPGLEVIHVPLDDTTMTPDIWKRAAAAARKVDQAHREGKKTLITCLFGMNRSGLVTAMAIHLRSGMSGREAVDLIQAKRPIALWNKSFVHALKSLPHRN